MDLFHCVSTQKLNESVKTIERAKSEDKEPVAPPRGARRTSLPAHSNKKLSNGQLNTLLRENSKSGTLSCHYEKKKSVESLNKITSRTLSPPPETLPRKFSRPSLTPSATPGRLPRHPELPPLHIEDNTGPRLKDYLEKPRLVSTLGRKASRGSLGQEEVTVDDMVPGLSQLTMYYSQTFLDTGDKGREANNSAHGNRSIV